MSRRRAPGGEAGFSLIEVLMAWMVMMIALGATLQVFAEAQEGTSTAQRRISSISVAQRELERVRALPYAKIGLTTAPHASAPTRVGRSATEGLIVGGGGVVDPGPVPFSTDRVKGKVYRFVTWRNQTCTGLNSALAATLDTLAVVPGGSSSVAIGDLCAGLQQTKRIVIAVVPDLPGGGISAPIRAETIIADPSTAVAVSANGSTDNVSLSVDAEQTITSNTTTPTEQEAAYAASETQTLHLYDTRCNDNGRQTGATSHATHDTGRTNATCTSAGNPPNLMGLTVPTIEPARDFSTDLLRANAEGLALKRDTVSGTCAQNASYTPTEANDRRWSVHRWVTKGMGATAETLGVAGRAVLTVNTRSVGAAVGSGRLCVLLRRSSDGYVIGTADLLLGSWPTKTTELSVGMDLAYAQFVSGDRLELVLRLHPDSTNDIELLYDRANADATLTLTMATGKTIQ